MQRGNQLDSLDDRADRLSAGADQFQRQSARVKNR